MGQVLLFNERHAPACLSMSLYSILRRNEAGRRKSWSCACELKSTPTSCESDSTLTRRMSAEGGQILSRPARRTSYNLDSVLDCLPPDPLALAARYVPEPLSRHSSQRAPPPPEGPHREAARSGAAPDWHDVRAQFDFARRSEGTSRIHARQAFLTLWTLHVISDRLCPVAPPVCI